MPAYNPHRPTSCCQRLWPTLFPATRHKFPGQIACTHAPFIIIHCQSGTENASISEGIAGASQSYWKPNAAGADGGGGGGGGQGVHPPPPPPPFFDQALSRFPSFYKILTLDPPPPPQIFFWICPWAAALLNSTVMMHLLILIVAHGPLMHVQFTVANDNIAMCSWLATLV